MLRVKNIMPDNYVEIDAKAVLGSDIGKVKIRSFNKKPSCVNRCLVIILWAYHLCKTTDNELVLEIPLKIEREKFSSLKFDMGIYHLPTRKYTHFIEYDGFSGHFTDVKMITNDILKERFCLTVGVKLLRISPKYVLNLYQLDNWFFNDINLLSYFNPPDYNSRNELIHLLKI